MSESTQRVELPRSPRSGTFWEVTIERLAPDGRGVGGFAALVGPQQEPKDFEFHVRKAVPGDQLEVMVERRSGDRIDARIEEIQQPSPMRVQPRCRHFGLRERKGEGCGGCTFQGLSYRHQLACKEKTVKQLVAKHGLDPGLVAPVLGCDEPWFYRNKMEFSFGDTDEREFALGMYPTGYTYEVLNLEECFLESEFVSELVPAARQWAQEHGIRPYMNSDNEGFARTITIREGKRTDERMINLMTTHAPEARFDEELVDARQVAEAFADWVLEFAGDYAGADGQSGGDGESAGEAVTSVYWTQKKAIRGQPTEYLEHCLWGDEALQEELYLPGDQRLSFEIHPRAFFQTNTLQAEVLYARALEAAGLLDAKENRASTVLDLYCGTGTIALCMAPYAERVVGVEMQSDSVRCARKNAEDNGIDNARFFEGDVGEVMGSEAFAEAAGDPDLVVVDPPRAGLQPDARVQVASVEAPRLVYVSCNPESFARDLVFFEEQGYTVQSIQPVDMFPQTYHIENVARLEL